MLDTLAAMVSGSRLLPGRTAIAYVESCGGTRQARVAGSQVVTHAENAALANGMLAHADETVLDAAYRRIKSIRKASPSSGTFETVMSSRVGAAY